MEISIREPLEKGIPKFIPVETAAETQQPAVPQHEPLQFFFVSFSVVAETPRVLGLVSFKTTASLSVCAANCIEPCVSPACACACPGVKKTHRKSKARDANKARFILNKLSHTKFKAIIIHLGRWLEKDRLLTNEYMILYTPIEYSILEGLSMAEEKHPSHQAEIRRLNRISGQVEGVKKMIEEQRYCPEILNQLRAIRAAVKGIEGEILRRHLSSCVTMAMQNGDETSRARSIDEVTRLFSKFEE